MSITNYSELKSAIASWGKRSDLTAVIPDFIALAEARINRTFLPRSQEVEVELSTVPGSRFVDCPTDMINPIGVWLKAYLPRQKLTQVLPADLPVKTNVSGYPEYWAIDGTRIAFDKLSSSAWSFDFRYTASFALSDAAPTNYILTHTPDLYLFGALIELHKYTMDDQQAAMYEQRFQQALQDASNNENDTRATAVLMTELGQMARNTRFNILRGY